MEARIGRVLAHLFVEDVKKQIIGRRRRFWLLLMGRRHHVGRQRLILPPEGFVGWGGPVAGGGPGGHYA